VKTIHLVDEDAGLLDDILDLHITGLKEAKETTISDPTHMQVESLLDSMGSIDEEIVRVSAIRELLK
jgi:hypothetical protein